MDTESNEEGIRLPVTIEQAVEKLFVYGIFLDEYNRSHYGMEFPSYDTVPDYITVGGTIVRAIKLEGYGASLTGLLVDIPTKRLPSVDALEAGYARIKVKTSGGIEAFMYASPSEEEDYSSYRSNLYEQE